MTRAEAYESGWHTGRLMAEDDISDKRPSFEWRVREWINSSTNDIQRAYGLGNLRGYRDTMARYESGELTWEMFEHEPLGKE